MGQLRGGQDQIAEVLRRELARKRQRGRALLSSVCDPYQPVEGKFRLTRQRLQAVRDFGWGIDTLPARPWWSGTEYSGRG